LSLDQSFFLGTKLAHVVLVIVDELLVSGLELVDLLD
jgi:hypothetical protein